MRTIGRLRISFIAGALMVVPGVAYAVGLGPLQKTGVTQAETKAFYLNLTNPYPVTTSFEAYVDEEGTDGDGPVRIMPAKTRIAPLSNRRLVVMIGGLEPGERRQVKVCARRAPIEGEIIRARVCSKLSAVRIVNRGSGDPLPDDDLDSDG